MRASLRALLTLVCVVLTATIVTPFADPHAEHQHAVAPAVWAQSDPSCTQTPLGALPPAIPTWCSAATNGPSTFVNGANSWEDNFDHGLSNASLGDGYVHGSRGDGRGAHFRHLNHWMIDLQAQAGQYPTLLAGFMRPDRTFRPVNGTIVIEMEVAVPIAGTRDIDALSDSWPELVLSTAPAPSVTNPWGSWLRPNGTYLYEAYPDAWTFGCRMQQSRHPICALYRPQSPGAPNYAGGPDRIWEVNQNGGDVTSQFGGDPSIGNLSTLWAVCGSNQDPDTVCRNVFRFELQANHLKLLVKRPGASTFSLYYEAGLIDSNLGNILNAPDGFYVFLGDFAYRITNGTVVRFHWDRLAVNPGASGPSPTATPTATLVPPTNTPTATLVPTATPTRTATPVPALCEYLVWVNGSQTTPNRQTTTDPTLRQLLGCP